MGCPQRSGNVISFTIPDHFKGTVIVSFNGTAHKRVEIDWGNGTSKVWGSCDSGIIPGVCYSESFSNNIKLDLSATVKIYYQDIPCSLAPSPSGWQPMNGGSMIVQNCNPNFNLITVSAWEFQVTSAQGGETVQVTVVVEDVNWTGEG